MNIGLESSTRQPSTCLGLSFPAPGPGLINAYRELDLALNGSNKDRAALGNLNELPRPQGS